MAVRIYRTVGSPTLNTKHTISMWLKRSKLTYGDCFLIDGYQDASNRFKLAFDSSDSLELYNTHGGSYKYNVKTNRKFRDTGAFYHLLIRIDMTQSSASDRVRIYVNGTEEESFGTYTDSTQDDANNVVNESGATLSIGDYQGGGNAFDGLMTHVHFIDGTSYGPDTFGETDSTSGIWKPKTAPSVTYGNNGFFLKFENSANMDLDSSPNNLTFTTSGTLTQNVDTPSNNFATFNPLKDGRMNGSTQYKATFTNGNTTSTFAESTYNTGAFSSLAVNSGKYYAEIKCSNKGGNTKLGLFSADDYGSNDFSGTYLYDSSGTFGGSAYGNSFTTGDIIQIAFDATNGTVWFGKNGTWQDSATQSEIEAGTTTNSAATGIDMTQFWHFGTYGVNATAFQANFGQGYFGTNAVASAGTAPSEGGIFEYDCPSGYQALCTKGINSF